MCVSCRDEAGETYPIVIRDLMVTKPSIMTFVFKSSNQNTGYIGYFSISSELVLERPDLHVFVGIVVN